MSRLGFLTAATQLLQENSVLLKVHMVHVLFGTFYLGCVVGKKIQYISGNGVFIGRQPQVEGPNEQSSAKGWEYLSLLILYRQEY